MVIMKNSIEISQQKELEREKEKRSIKLPSEIKKYTLDHISKRVVMKT